MSTDASPAGTSPSRWVIDTVISGSVTLSRDGRSETFAAGDTFFIAKGTPCTWEITQTLRKFYMIAA